MKNNKKIIYIATPLLVLILIGIGLYYNKTMWLFTPSYNQRSTVNSYLNDIYSGDYKSAYKLVNPILQTQLPYDSFIGKNLPIRNKYNVTTFKSYKIAGKSDIITGNIKDKSHGLNYNFSIIVNSSTNKINYILIQPN